MSAESITAMHAALTVAFAALLSIKVVVLVKHRLHVVDCATVIDHCDIFGEESACRQAESRGPGGNLRAVGLVTWTLTCLATACMTP